MEQQPRNFFERENSGFLQQQREIRQRIEAEADQERQALQPSPEPPAQPPSPVDHEAVQRMQRLHQNRVRPPEVNGNRVVRILDMQTPNDYLLLPIQLQGKGIIGHVILRQVKKTSTEIADIATRDFSIEFSYTNKVRLTIAIGAMMQIIRQHSQS